MTFSEWIAGAQIEGTLLGLEVVLWQRAAKLLQIIAGLVIIVEILGPARINKIGEKLHKMFTLPQLLRVPKPVRIHRLISKKRKKRSEISSELSAIKIEPKSFNRRKIVSMPDPNMILGPNTFKMVVEGTKYKEWEEANPKYSEEENKIRAAKIAKMRLHLCILDNQITTLRGKLKFGYLFYAPGYAGVLVAYVGMEKLYGYFDPLPQFMEIILAIAILVLSFYAFSSIAIALFSIVSIGVMTALEVAILNPVGRLLTHKRFKEIILALSLLLFVIGSIVELVLI